MTLLDSRLSLFPLKAPSKSLLPPSGSGNRAGGPS